MLNNIKNMINQKKEFLETAKILFEEATDSLDDYLFLNEGKDEDELDEIDDSAEDDVTTDNNDGSDEKEDASIPEDNSEDPSDDEDTDEPGSTGDVEEQPIEDDDLSNNIDNEPIGDDNPEDGKLTDDLPDLVGKQTGEPVEDNIDDLLDATIDLKSDTIKDILPVPPSNASDAVMSDDILDQRVDSGFGDEPSSESEPVDDNGTDIENEPIEDNNENNGELDESDLNVDDLLSEAISLGDGDAPAEMDEQSDNGGETNMDGLEDTTEGDEGENDVTAAVRDKVAEAEAPQEAEVGSAESKDELLKKLGNITKSLEDAKKAIMNTIQ